MVIDNEYSLVSEELEPSGIGGPHLKVVASSGVLDVE
jgi:hypothetical protein